MLRKTPWTAWFRVNRASQSAVESSPSGSPSSRRASASPASTRAPCRVSRDSRKPQPPPVTSTSRPPTRYRIGGSGVADIEGSADLGEGLLGDAAGLDHDGAVVDLEPVDVAGGGPAAQVAEPLGDQGAVAEVGQPGRGEQAARARSDHDDVEGGVHNSS